MQNTDIACHPRKLLKTYPSVSTLYVRLVIALHWFNICCCVEHTICVNIFLKEILSTHLKNPNQQKSKNLTSSVRNPLINPLIRLGKTSFFCVVLFL